MWKHPWICLTKKSENHDGRSLWLWVNDILLDSSNEALVLDCCILFVSSLANPASIRLGAALDYCRALESPPLTFIEVRQRLEGLRSNFLPHKRDAPEKFH